MAKIIDILLISVIGASNLIVLKRAIKAAGKDVVNGEVVKYCVKLVTKKIMSQFGAKVLLKVNVVKIIGDIIMTACNLSWGQIIVMLLCKVFKTQYIKVTRKKYGIFGKKQKIKVKHIVLSV